MYLLVATSAYERYTQDDDADSFETTSRAKHILPACPRWKYPFAGAKAIERKEVDRVLLTGLIA